MLVPENRQCSFKPLVVQYVLFSQSQSGPLLFWQSR